MDGDRGRKLGSFVIGGVVGSVAALAAAGRVRVRDRTRRRTTSPGLAAFEHAPCFREVLEREGAPSEAEDGRELH